MSKSATSVFYFGIYLLLTGLALLTAPNMLLGLFGLAETSEVWIRVVGMLVLLLSGYYIIAARHDLRPFFQMSVYLRASVILFFAIFVGMGMVGAPLLLFGLIDLAGALWTLQALKGERSPT
ncbi:MAG: hypothetical protein H6574_16280 [Lewinellaceae bacterium]|nr:hypothetical protein [Saprospiraceae bacterium]MCB9332631.1 hypothetical protein [Lewinellaceae bacterium]